MSTQMLTVKSFKLYAVQVQQRVQKHMQVEHTHSTHVFTVIGRNYSSAFIYIANMNLQLRSCSHQTPHSTTQKNCFVDVVNFSLQRKMSGTKVTINYTIYIYSITYQFLYNERFLRQHKNGY